MRGGWFAGSPIARWRPYESGGPFKAGRRDQFLFCGSHYTGTVAAFGLSLIPCLTYQDLSYSHRENLHNCKINLAWARKAWI